MQRKSTINTYVYLQNHAITEPARDVLTSLIHYNLSYKPFAKYIEVGLHYIWVLELYVDTTSVEYPSWPSESKVVEGTLVV